MQICVYGASSDKPEKEFHTAARKLGRLIAEAGHGLVYGGGSSGLMARCAEGALECGGTVTGVAPHFFDQDGVLLKSCTEFIFTDTMGQRKAKMEDLADAFIALPGGIGTFEEFFETLTLKQLGRHCKPIALVNTLEYYASLQSMLDTAVAGGFMSKSCMELYALCQTPEEALDYVLHAETRKIGSGRLSDYGK